MDEKKTLQELWALPINMKPLPFDFAGKKLYSSDKLKLKFFEAILSTEWGKYHAKNIKRLVQEGYIVPTIMNKGILSFLAKKFLTKDWTKNVQGLYFPDLNKVLIFIDNNSTWMGLSSNKTLVKTTLHETMHLSASKNMAGFFKIMKPTFEKFYSNYYSNLFSCKEINVDKILKAMYKTEGVFSQSLHKNLMSAILNETNKCTTLEKIEYDELAHDLFYVTRIMPISSNLIVRYYPRFYHLFGPLNTAYMETFKERNSYTSPVQELWALSEVASVMAEMLPVDRRVSQILSNIK